MKKKRFIKVLRTLLLLTVTAAILCPAIVKNARANAEKMAKNADPKTENEDLPASAQKECVLLLIGVDAEREKVCFLMLSRVDPNRKTIAAKQLSPSVLQYGEDARTITDKVSQLTGVGIDAYVLLDTKGFAKAVDMIGGIDPDFPAAFEAGGRFFPAGRTLIDGRTASRLMCADPESADADFDKFLLQEILLRETLGTIRKEFSFVRAAAIAGAVFPYVKTDLGFSGILSLVRAGMGISGENVTVGRFSEK